MADHRCAPLWRVWLDGDEAGAVHLHAVSDCTLIRVCTDAEHRAAVELVRGKRFPWTGCECEVCRG